MLEQFLAKRPKSWPLDFFFRIFVYLSRRIA